MRGWNAGVWIAWRVGVTRREGQRSEREALRERVFARAVGVHAIQGNDDTRGLGAHGRGDATGPGGADLDSRGCSPANGGVPKSGQPWDASFMDRSVLLRELRTIARPLLGGASWPTLDAYGAFVEAERSARAGELPVVRFAPPARRVRSQPVQIEQLYDGSIALRGEVPCVGSSYHDFLNALVWGAFPRAKRALHARQYRALTGWVPQASARLPNRRTREQDALALFDEGGSVVVVPSDEGAREWCAVPRELAAGSSARIVLFGHALMEHVCFESSPVSSAALLLFMDRPVPDGRELIDRVDRALAARLENPAELAEPTFDRVLSIEPPDRACLEAPSDELR